jgi:hypothetical protein
MSRKAWKTPSYQGSGRICRPLFIPNDPQWLAAVGGALSELTKEYNWEQVGITPQRASEIAAEMLLRFYTEECGDGTGGPIPRIYRRGTRGQLQFSEDGGETWEDEAELGIFPPVPPRPEPTPDDKRCLAARNAVEVLHRVYLELLDAWNEDSSIQFGIAAFATILGLLIAALFGAPILVITALINFAIEAFGGAYALMAVLGDDDWTASFTDELTCLFLENATVNAGVVSFDYMAIRDNLSTLHVDPALIAWLWYIMQIIGEEGINHAGATTAISEYDCGGCDEVWCHKIDFTLSDGGWAVKTAGRGTWVAGEGWRSSNIDGGQRLHISRDFMPNIRITRIDSDVSYVYGSHVMGDLIRLWLHGEQTGSLPPSWGVCDQATHRLTVGDIGHPATYDRIDLIGQCYNERGGCSNQGAAVGVTVHSITIYGVGYNPFGTDNCEA